MRFFLFSAQTKTKGGKNVKHNLKSALRRIYTDFSHRTLFFLYGGCFFNGVYAGIYILLSLLFGTEMLLVFSLYYTMLAVNRLFLIRSYRLYQKGSVKQPWRIFRHSGVFIFALGLSMIPLSFFLRVESKSAFYPPLVLFVSFAYTLTVLILSLRGSARHRQSGSPILSAAKNVSITGALVSLLSLQGALTHFSRAVGALSVCLTLFLGIFMTVYGKKRLKKTITQKTCRLQLE